VAPARCSPGCRGRAAALTAHSQARCTLRRPLHAAAPAGCSHRCRGRAAAPTAHNPSRHLHAVAPADCSPRCHAPAALPARCSPRRLAHASGRAGRNPSRLAPAEAHLCGSRSSPGLPSPCPPQAAVVAPWSGAPPLQRPRRPPGHAAGFQDGHTPSCRHAAPHQRPCPRGGIPTNGRRPARPRLDSAEDRPRAFRPPRGSPGWYHPHAPGRTPAPGHWVTRYPKDAEPGTDAHQPPRCQNHAGIGMAAHRPPYARPGHSHRPGPARCQNPHAAHLHAQRQHARHQDARLPRHVDPPKQPHPALRLYPGRQVSGRNHVPPNPLHADRTPLPPRLPPPLPSGPSTYPAQCRPVGYLGAEFCPRPDDLPDGASPEP
jgi:hypothetical protein